MTSGRYAPAKTQKNLIKAERIRASQQIILKFNNVGGTVFAGKLGPFNSIFRSACTHRASTAAHTPLRFVAPHNIAVIASGLEIPQDLFCATPDEVHWTKCTVSQLSCRKESVTSLGFNTILRLDPAFATSILLTAHTPCPVSNDSQLSALPY